MMHGGFELVGVPRGAMIAAAAGLVIFLAMLVATEANSEPQAEWPPPTLFETGLYADAEALAVDPRNLPFSPQYPLWTDGADKSRWIRLPPGGVIDGSDVDAWRFPVGTRLWKEFAFGGRRVETRFMELGADGRWIYAAYEWAPDGRTAVMAPPRGRRNGFELVGGAFHAIPGTIDCKVCHEGGPAVVLGFSALQLSPKRDGKALHQSPAGVDLDYLRANGLITGTTGWPSLRPEIVAPSEAERLVLGYLHGNCGQCHNSRSALSNLGMFLRHELLRPVDATQRTIINQKLGKRPPGMPEDVLVRVAPGHPELSALFQRISSRAAALQMPPLGTVLVDEQAVELFRRWITELAADPAVEGGRR